MEQQPKQNSINHEDNSDPEFERQVQRLYELTVYSRWLLIVFVWLTIVPICLWNLRMEIALWKEYFTFAAVRYGLISHPLAALGLAFSVGMILAVLIWQSRNILFGLSSEEKKLLEDRVWRIRKQGSNHPLWKWICN
ncbi:hypothetical protein [Mastigocoleus testarum]|uniref:Uncharacterized protein n=1 Tax=Mastigocoleus testarum BC008 TaxID=371196 RepID=A0A0V7ZUR4_9CYAN|nr:hypothetical protein [Mastigocoleus testarum]KST67955.1 hypothetical protein BC008_31685 [Mastigocoleus testarum BC008]KST68420.1 hypothetical protein BC008_33440 [Mastigocoleus testarum BC008]